MSDRGAYVRSYYGVPAHKGGRIRFHYNGEDGTIVGFDGQYLVVAWDSSAGEAAKAASRLHPTWKVEYLDG